MNDKVVPIGTVDRDSVPLAELPPELQQQLSKSYLQQSTSHDAIMEVITTEPQSLDDVMVAYWRKTGEIIKRQTARSALKSLVDEGKINKVEVGKYKL